MLQYKVKIYKEVYDGISKLMNVEYKSSLNNVSLVDVSLVDNVCL